MPRSRSISIVSSTCSRISRASSPPQTWISRSARVDLPWSIWAMIAKLRIWLSGVVILLPWAGPEHKDAAAPDQRAAGPGANSVRVPRPGCRVPWPLSSNLRRKCPPPASCPAGTDTPPLLDAVHRACGQESETAPTLAPESSASSPPYRSAPVGCAHSRQAHRSVGKRVSDSRPRIRAACWKPNAVAKPDREESAPPTEAERERSSCQRRSPICAVAPEVSHEPFEGDPGNGFRRWRFATGISGGREPALANSSRQDRVVFIAVGDLPGRHKFRDRATAIGNDDRFAGTRGPDVFAELVLEDFEADGAHGGKVATRGYFVNADRRGHDGATERLVTRGAAAG